MPIQMDLADVAAFVCKQRSCSLIADLGVGAHKRAYLIEQDGARFALKIAPITPSLKPRFEREATALAGCKHPSVAVLHESVPLSLGGNEFWVSIEEYLSGGTLSSRVAAGQVDHALVRRIGLSLADALDHLRERNLVHRDIKPANVLFRSADEAVLTDFGIVRMLDAPTLTQEFLPQGPGTPLYASAEQLLNEMVLIDWRTDQFGLAVVLAECAIGYHPFTPEGDVPLAISRVAKRQAVPPESCEKLAAAGFGSLIKAMAPWPVQRYRYPKDFIHSLSVE